MAGTYPNTVLYRGKRYRFLTREYERIVATSKSRTGRDIIRATAKEERARGYLTRIVKRVGRTHTVYFLYVREKKSRRE